jgi:hypothetical protein
MKTSGLGLFQDKHITATKVTKVTEAETVTEAEAEMVAEAGAGEMVAGTIPVCVLSTRRHRLQHHLLRDQMAPTS